jgi:putative ABC transport system permease protein
MQLVAGRNLAESDTAREMLVNETLLRKLNVKPEDALGQTIAVGGGIPKPIVGVLKDFHLNSLREAIEPCFITTERDRYQVAGVKIAANHIPPTLKQIEKVWTNTFPDQVYEYHFLDENIAEFYKQESILLKLVNTFASIAIVIGCLGLYGLVSFMVETKTKEVGIRKVLGANVGSILALFGKEFAKLIFLAFFVAVPVAWWLMSKWLQDYPYRISLGVGIFVSGIFITLILAAFTVGYRSFKAAIANPVDSLRAE